VALVAAGVVLTLWAALSAVAEIPLQRGLEAAASGDLVAAQYDFDIAHDLRPWDVSIPQTAGHAFVAIASSTTGIESKTATSVAGPWLVQVQSALPHNEELALDQASLAELAGHYAQARTILASALAADPDNPAILLRLGVVEGESGRLAQAAADLNEVIHIDPTSAAPWNDLALVYRLQHRPEAAARASARAQKLDASS
jgi:tetratricopeptide (TPR) repeat protein